LRTEHLLFLDVLIGVHDHELEFTAHRHVLPKNPALKDAESSRKDRLKDADPCPLRKFQLRTAFQDPVHDTSKSALKNVSGRSAAKL